ncbi:hypothetical protein B0H11DRAFT_2289986 [Mycena galericulata]|nr:hypothetical protein B0H11DRAFT_2289986 [Mycena galericulata]
MSVKELQARIEKISTDIERNTRGTSKKEVLHDLERSKSLAQRQLNTICDPIARLPLEIPSEIFMQCLPILAEPGAHNIPMVLLNICSTWADIALSTPALWAAVRVVFPRPEGFRQLLSTWLQRARNHPLSISLTNTFHKGVMSIMWRHSQQLNHLELCYDSEKVDDEDSDGDEEIDIFGRTSPGPLPLLETLAIRRPADPGVYPAYLGSQILEILRLAPNLVECVFDRMRLVHGRVDPVEGTSVLPTLRRLMFGRDGRVADSEAGILTRLSTPRLETLSLSMVDLSDDDFLSFLKRSSPPLRDLVLNVGFNDGDFARLDACLCLVPTLTLFDFSWPGDRMFRQLLAALAESPPRLLPNLRTLTVDLHINNAITDASLKILLRAIAVRRTQLQCVHINLSRPMNLPSLEFAPNIVAAFRELIAEGLEVYIGTPTRNLISV